MVSQFHGFHDDGFAVEVGFRPNGNESNPTPYWTVNLIQGLRCFNAPSVDGKPPERHNRIELSMFLQVEHMRALRDALTTALVGANLEEPAAAALHGQQEQAFALGVRAVIDYPAAKLHGVIDPAEFDYDEELRATAPFTPEEARP